MRKKKIKKIDLFFIFLRSFFIQTVYNFKGLLSVGMCFALLPVAKRLYATREERQAFMQRHLCFFNTHPYFSAFALGAISAVEEENACSGSCNDEQMNKFKNALIGPLGAIGDQLFWASIKPAAILVGITGVMIVRPLEFKLIFLAIFLILYNAPHLFIRWVGLVRGYRYGFEVYKLLKIEKFSTLREVYRIIGAGALGVFTGYAFFTAISRDHLAALVLVLCIIAAYIIKVQLKRVYWPIILPLVITLFIGFITTL